MDWAPGDHARFMAGLAERYDKVCSEIDQTVMEIAAAVARHDPLRLLHRAWWERSAGHTTIEAEVDVGGDEAMQMRMVDYVQSIIAATPPSGQHEELTEERWGKLKALVKRLFDLLNVDYFLSATARRRKDEQAVDEAQEEFEHLSQKYWCNVTGEQYQVHQISALRELLAPQTTIVQALYGLSSEQLCEELEKVWESLVVGLNDGFEALTELQERATAAVEMDRAAGLTTGDPGEDIRAAIERHGLRALHERAVGTIVEYHLFDLQKVTSLPPAFLEDFSWAPGEDAAFFSDGPFKGWPLRVWPTFKRPFLKVGGTYFCFDGSTLFDHFYRQLEKRVFKASGAVKQQWIEGRKRVTEELPFSYLGQILPGAETVKEIYYDEVESNGRKKRCEADGLLIYDDHLFIVEVKSGAFTYTSPAIPTVKSCESSAT